MNNATKAVMEINNHMLSLCEIDSLFQTILDKALKIFLNCETGSILFMKDNKLSYKATRGYLSDRTEEITYKLEDIYLYKTYNMEYLYNPIIISDLEKTI